MFLSLPIYIGRIYFLRSDFSVWWGYKVKVIRQRSVIIGQCWGIHSYSRVDRDHSRDCDGKGKLGSKSNQFETGKKEAHDCE